MVDLTVKEKGRLMPVPERSSDDFDAQSIDWYVERLGERNAELRRLRAIRDQFGEPAILAAEVERLREALRLIAGYDGILPITTTREIAKDALAGAPPWTDADYDRAHGHA
jgi:hypothetical protein